MTLPYLTADLPGIGGAIKQRPEDFFVQELPLYEPSGSGEHVYCEIEKVGLTTFDAVGRLAEALGVSARDIGFAGMKDAQAVTRQVVSIPAGAAVDEAAVMNLGWPNLKVLWASRHGNKLRLGHLRGNRFAIKVRGVASPTDVVKLRPILDILERRGMPNYFGEQRFGRRANNDALGAALLRDDPEAVLRGLLGDPRDELDDGATLKARRLYEAGDLEGAMRAWPRRSGMERRVLARLIKTRKPWAAVNAVDERVRRLWLSAVQSRVFNDVLARRLDSIDRVMDGDFAFKHENGACFLVDSAAAEQPRCDAFEISPTGPLPGYRMSMPAGEPMRIEQEVLSRAGLAAEHFRSTRVKVRGERRPLRVRPADTQLEGGVDGHGAYVTAAFTLPSGSFATVLMGEMMKEATERRSDEATKGPSNEGDGTESE